MGMPAAEDICLVLVPLIMCPGTQLSRIGACDCACAAKPHSIEGRSLYAEPLALFPCSNI